MYRYLSLLLLISIVWGQKQLITLKKGNDIIIINQKNRMKIVTKEKNKFKGSSSSLLISNAGIKVNDKWETIESIQLCYPKRYGEKGFLLFSAISFIEILPSISNDKGYSLDLLYTLFSGGFGYLAGYITGIIVHFDKRKPLMINESEWQILE
tara:strand:- start:416 stop:874 length:459 start_codon:yes stop_codon:yes gene_type:complete